MPNGPRYFLFENGAVTGPHSLAVLKQKADIHVITPETPISHESDPAAWTPLRESEVLHAELFSERPRFALGPKPIEQVNAPSEPHAALSVTEMLRANTARQRAAEGELLPSAPPRSKQRRRDFLFLVIAGNLLGILGFIFLPMNPIVFVSLVAYFAIFNTSLIWVMFVVMDRY